MELENMCYCCHGSLAEALNFALLLMHVFLLALCSHGFPSEWIWGMLSPFSSHLLLPGGAGEGLQAASKF